MGFVIGNAKPENVRVLPPDRKTASSGLPERGNDNGILDTAMPYNISIRVLGKRFSDALSTYL